jgi:hypothetical protein
MGFTIQLYLPQAPKAKKDTGETSTNWYFPQFLGAEMTRFF